MWYIRFIKRYLLRFINNIIALIVFNTKGRILGAPKHIQGIQNIRIGSRTTIDKGCRLDCYKTNFHNPIINIGKNCLIGFDCTFLSTGKLIIEDDVLFASNVFVTTENHGINPLLGNYMFQNLDSKDVYIESNCWIGENVTILPGVHIGKWSIIGANSVVTKSIPEYSLAVGNPAKVVKRFNFDLKYWEKIEMINYDIK